MRDVFPLGPRIKRLQARHHAAANAVLADLGVSIVQWDALLRLRQQPDASLHDLAQRTHQSDQSFGTLAVRLETRGLVERVPAPGRAVRLRLTAEGERVLDAATDRVRAMLERSFAPLSDDEVAVLGGMLDRLLAVEHDRPDAD